MDFSRLKDIREDKDISQQKMAEILEVNRSTYSLWELGINIIPLRNLCDFANYFSYSLDYVLGLSNNRKLKVTKTNLDLRLLGNNINALRLKNNLTQERLAKVLNISQAGIVRYEKGNVCISTSNLYKIAMKFNISLEDLCFKKL